MDDLQWGDATGMSLLCCHSSDNCLNREHRRVYWKIYYITYSHDKYMSERCLPPSEHKYHTRNILNATLRHNCLQIPFSK
jgi:hypothetical protein